MAMLLSRLPDEQVGAVRDTFGAAVLERYGPNVTKLPVEVIVGIAQQGCRRTEAASDDVVMVRGGPTGVGVRVTPPRY